MELGNFVSRHIGSQDDEVQTILQRMGVESLDSLIDEIIPSNIRLSKTLSLDKGLSERQYFRKIHALAQKNKVFNSYIGMGYYDTITPAVILRNVLENPSWYTSYTPYQAEISQGRLEALLNFQTLVCDLTGFQIANASLLDEATAAAEAMMMMYNIRGKDKKNAKTILVDEAIWPQTLDVLLTRAEPFDIQILLLPANEMEIDESIFGAIVQYPNANGEIIDYSSLAKKLHQQEALLAVSADLLSLAILSPPQEWGADISFGTTQRMGVPMGYGGPAAAYFATTEANKRFIPGRIIGISKDKNGNRALRMALQTREQHIKRERATSNICTAQALLAIMSSFYAVYHGPTGIKNIALRVHHIANLLSTEISKLGYKVVHSNYFDTIKIIIPEEVRLSDIRRYSLDLEINFRYFDSGEIGISVDETTNLQDINWILEILASANNFPSPHIESITSIQGFDSKFTRKTEFLTQEVFNKYHSETEMLRYIKRLERKDISLTHSMISLGSCTMKLNAATEMLPLSWIEFNGLHPFVPFDQAAGYHELFKELRRDLSIITGFSDISLQPNSGAAGEYAGLMVIREYHKSIGQGKRNIILIPSSAHGTNPASAILAGMKTITIACDEEGNISFEDLKEKSSTHQSELSCLMITYPSTHGVYESRVKEMCEIIHNHGGQVYMDGANMNAQVGLTNPALIGADVCHLNLHKTFAIPHGGGGPGVGPIGVAKHLGKFLPGHSVVDTDRSGSAVSSSPWGSASVLPITYGYIKMLGCEGLTQATKIAILNANYLAHQLKDTFGIVYTGNNNRVAHELILECRHLKKFGISELDIAKRLIDYGFHAPTLSFPVHGTLMIEPTESESLRELDRFVEALKSIFLEIKEIEAGIAPLEDNVLKNAPHTEFSVVSDSWTHSYGREKAAFPLQWIRENKFWPSVARIDDAFGDRNLICTCG